MWLRRQRPLQLDCWGGVQYRVPSKPPAPVLPERNWADEAEPGIQGWEDPEEMVQRPRESRG